jgi:hypothetical protein
MTMNRNESICRLALQAVDPYGGGEIDAAAGAEWRQHVESCAACGKELAARREVRARLKTAAHRVEMPLGFETRVRAGLRAAEHSPRWPLRLGSLAVTAGLCLAIGVAYQQGHLRITESSQESYVASMSDRVATFLQAGLQNHLHCAVFRKYPKTAPSLEQAVAELNPKYAPLVPVVKKHVPADYQVMMSHLCEYRGRRFIHVALRNSQQLLSVLVMRRKGEAIDGVLPALQQSGVALYQGGAQRYQIASFESGSFRVYLVSEMEQTRNLKMLAAMAPEIQVMLQSLEA